MYLPTYASDTSYRHMWWLDSWQFTITTKFSFFLVQCNKLSIHCYYVTWNTIWNEWNQQITLVHAILVTWKLICVSYVFFHAEFKHVIRTALSCTGFVRQNFLKCNFNKFTACCHTTTVLNMAEANYILNIVWAWKLNRNKDSRHVSPITDSQTMQGQTYTNM
jgi:hypothetical protein